jgi:hypothetical protein
MYNDVFVLKWALLVRKEKCKKKKEKKKEFDFQLSFSPQTFDIGLQMLFGIGI